MKTALLTAISGCAIALSLITFQPAATAQTAPRSPQSVTRVRDIAWANLSDFDRPTHRLTTQAVSIDTMFQVEMALTENLSQTSEAIPSARALVPAPVNLIDALTDLPGTVDRFLAQTPQEPEPFKPLAFFEIPGLESGVKVGLLNF
ncbi:hypothetical protein IQ266_10585 [filamentous cyanobacterium LEGE 11480]|uniref:Uncharacterized protein n=1 Tax=Romeriopsis navalis LEGE 11480 TaxID=2777977 RepID=A0A928VPD1_9CYAN|nr:hypothetical protein [Romeriopsis navalis]MBE9030175.1 hypothetical protein [Romeriopsis navalis LEGE 11480]